MREIVLDTETTGLDPGSGDRVVEIGCLELVNHMPTGEVFHCYLNPERDMPEGAFRVHGLSEEFLSDQPVFDDAADGFLEFIAADPLVIHNAEFDLRFLNAELDRVRRPIIDRARAVDTLAIARRKYPGAQASLDALCRRFEIDLSRRTQHGALLDAQLLSEVYLHLIGGRQPGFALDAGIVAEAASAERQERPTRPARAHAPSAGETTQHAALLDRLIDPIWRK